MPGSAHYTGTWSPSPGSPWVEARGTPACRDGGAEGGSHLHCQAQGWTTAGLLSHCPTSYNSRWSRRGETWRKWGGGVFPMVLTSFPPALPSQNTDITHTYTHSLCHHAGHPALGPGSPEERVVLNADLPQPLGRPVVWELKADGALKLLVLQNQGGGWEGRPRPPRLQPILSELFSAWVTLACSFIYSFIYSIR